MLRYTKETRADKLQLPSPPRPLLLLYMNLSEERLLSLASSSGAAASDKSGKQKQSGEPPFERRLCLAAKTSLVSRVGLGGRADSKRSCLFTELSLTLQFYTATALSPHGTYCLHTFLVQLHCLSIPIHTTHLHTGMRFQFLDGPFGPQRVNSLPHLMLPISFGTSLDKTFFQKYHCVIRRDGEILITSLPFLTPF